MAKNEVFYFYEFAKQLFLGEHNLQGDDIRYFLAKNTTPPAVDDAEPVYGDYDEVTTTYNIEGGLPVPNRTVTQTSGTVTFDHDTLQALAESAGPTFSYIIIYNNSHPLRPCIFFIEVVDNADSAAHDLSTTPYRWTPNAAGLFVGEKDS